MRIGREQKKRHGAMKRILIIDDGMQILSALQKEARSARGKLNIDVVGRCEQALERIEQTTYDLLIVNDGAADLLEVQWLQKLHERWPQLFYILLVDEADGSIAEKMKDPGNTLVVTRPIDPVRFRKLVLNTLAEKKYSDPLRIPLHGEIYQRIHIILVELFQDLGARCICLVDVEGCCIDRIGNADELPIGKIASLMGSHSIPSAELGNLMDGRAGEAILTYREGELTDLCMLTVNQYSQLMMVFARGGNCLRLGTIHFFSRQAAAAIASILSNPSVESPEFHEEVLIKEVIIKEADQFIEQLEGNRVP